MERKKIKKRSLRLFSFLGIKATAIALISLAIIILLIVIYLSHTSEAKIVDKQGVEVSPTAIDEIRAIGEWEFLSISDEELVDTTRHGFFSNDHLARIYYGTLRLGIDTHELDAQWLRMDNDTVVATLPDIKLLDDHFIDEARTRAFFESGKWSGADKDALYLRAKEKMMQRCMTSSNIKSAQQNAALQFDRILRTLGINYVKITFKENKKK